MDSIAAVNLAMMIVPKPVIPANSYSSPSVGSKVGAGSTKVTGNRTVVLIGTDDSFVATNGYETANKLLTTRNTVMVHGQSGGVSKAVNMAGKVVDLSPQDVQAILEMNGIGKGDLLLGSCNGATMKNGISTASELAKLRGGYVRGVDGGVLYGNGTIQQGAHWVTYGPNGAPFIP
jgi:hypothetical protein